MRKCVFNRLAAAGITRGTGPIGVIGTQGRSLHSWALGQLVGWGRRQQQQRADSSSAPSYPQQQRKFRLGHIQLDDSFSWLCDYERARPYLQQEQRHFELFCRQRLGPSAQQLLGELKQQLAAVQVDDPAEAVGTYQYATQHNPHGQDTIVRRCTATGQQTVLLSQSSLEADAAAASKRLGIAMQGASVGALKLSRDQQLLAYALSPDDGSEAAVCVAKDLRTGTLLQDCLLPAVGSFEWSADARCLCYTTSDEAGRPSKVYRHMLGTPASSDVLLLSEPDPRHFVTLTRTKDWAFLLVNSHSKLSSEVHLLDACDPAAGPVLIQRRQPGHEYFVEHWHSHLLLLSNSPPPATASGSSQQAEEPPPAAGEAAAAAPCDYSLWTVPAAAAAMGQATAEHWRLLRPEHPGSAVADMDVFQDRVVLHEAAAGPRLTLLTLAEQRQPGGTAQLVLQQEQQVVLPDWVFSLRPGINQDYHSSSMRLYASSPAVPELPLQLDLASAQLSVVGGEASHQRQHQTVPSTAAAAAAAAGGGCIGSALPPLQCRRLAATAADGTRVPLTLLQSQGLPATGQQPLLLEVYGAYGQALEADFRPHRLPLLQRGWSVALAHVRGGGEHGRRWHAGGRQLLKRNSVQDLLACLQLLFDTGVSRPGLVAGHAVSAGGLTLAAAVNAWPGAFGAVVMEAPYLDWAGSMAGLGQDVLTEHETDEWGDPAADQRVAELIAGMCPYTQLGAGSSSSSTGGSGFPAVLVTAGLMDTRVPFWMPLKYVAKLRALQQQQSNAAAGTPPEGRGSRPPVLLQFDEGSGHFSMGVSGGSLQDVAVQTAFLLHVVNTEQQSAPDGG